VQWFAPDATRERQRLESWCAGVGGVAIAGPSTDRGVEQPGIDEIVFVSWNVHVGGGDIRGFVSDLRSGIHTNGRRVVHYVLLLQEAVRTDGVPAFGTNASGAGYIDGRGSAGHIDIIQVAQDLGLSLIYVPSMRNGRSVDDPRQDRGNAILSTLPLSAPVAVELPGERQRRVAILAKVSSISVGTIHLDALGSAKRLFVFWTPWLRDVQIHSLAPQLPDGPLVLGADLNSWHGRDELAVRFLNGLTRETPVSIDRHGLGLLALDHLFFRAGRGLRAYYRQLARTYGSDHRPLVGWVEREITPSPGGLP
jgi:hypothetical protein